MDRDVEEPSELRGLNLVKSPSPCGKVGDVTAAVLMDGVVL